MNSLAARLAGFYIFPAGFFLLALAAWLIMPNIHKEGHLHTFHLLIFSAWHMVFFVGAIIESLLISEIKEKPKRVLWLLYILVGMAMYVVVIFYMFAYGHIDEHGITYKSMDNILIEQTASWSQVENPVFLRLIYYDKRNRGYSHRIVIRLANARADPMLILFNDDIESRETLLKVLRIMKNNNKQIIILSDKITIDKALSSLETAQYFKEISVIAPIYFTRRMDFVELR